jgi:hypothetical protein
MSIEVSLLVFVVSMLGMAGVGAVLTVWVLCPRLWPTSQVSGALVRPISCKMCDGDFQVCNVCWKPGGKCACPDSSLPTPMRCPACCEVSP